MSGRAMLAVAAALAGLAWAGLAAPAEARDSSRRSSSDTVRFVGPDGKQTGSALRRAGGWELRDSRGRTTGRVVRREDGYEVYGPDGRWQGRIRR